MAATVRTSSSATTGAAVASSVSPAIPTGTTTGDLMVAAVSINGITTINTPSGWTSYDSNPNSSVNKIYIFYRFWQSGDAAPSFTLASGTAMMSAGIVSVIGADPLFPIAGSTGGTNNTASTTLPTVASTPKDINTLQLSFHATRNTTAAATITPNILSENIDTSTTATPFIGLWAGSRTFQTGSQAAVLNQTATTASVRASYTMFIRSAQNGSDITPDVSVIADDTVGNSTITTAAFTTNRTKELLVAYVGTSGTGGTTTVSGAGLTWTKQKESSVNGGTAAIWTAWASSVVTAQTVTATFSVASNTVSLTVISYYGASQVLGTTNSATSASGSAPTVNLTTTVNNSLVVSMSTIVNATTFVPGTGVFVARNRSDGLSHQYGVLHTSAVTATSGTVVTMGATTTAGSAWDTVALEIEPSVSPTVALNTPADTATGIGTTPVLEFTGTDANSELIEYEVEVDSVNTFNSQTVSDTIVPDSFSASVDGTTSPHTWSHTVGSGTNRLLVVQIAVQGSTQGTVTAVTYGGVSMTKATAKQQVTTAGDSEVSIWLLFNPTVGTATVSVTATMPTLPDISGVGQSYFGAQQSTTPDAIGSGGGSTAGTSTATFTTVATGAWIVGMMNFFGNGSTSGSITSSQTIRNAGSMVSNLNGRYSAVDTNATVTPGSNTITFTSTDGTGATQRGYAIAAISIAPGTVQVPLIDKVSTTDAGFLNTVNGANTHPFTSAQKVSYTVQVANTLAGGTYYWRVRGIDPSGSNTYGAWATTRSFTVTAGSTITKTQPAIARIAINQTLAQPATARVARNIPKTQPAVSRIAVAVTKTQPAIARVARNLTLTQPATARIANSGVVKTQPAIARIATNRALTQGAISRISNNRLLTQPATARIGNSYIAALASYWKFDDASGTTVADSIGGNNGTWTGTISSQWGTGRINGDGVFNGSDYVLVGDKANLSFGTGSYSLYAWVKTTATSRQTIINKYQYTGTSVESGYYIDMLANGAIRTVYETTNANLRNTDSSIAINDGNWHLIVAVRPSTTGNILLYIDGVLDSGATNPFNAGTPGNIDNTIPFAIGQTISGSIGVNNWSGAIDEVGVWSRALTAPEVSNLYASGAGLAYPFTAVTVTKTQPATARIALSVTKTQPAVGRIAINRTKTQSGISRIATNRTVTQPAVASIIQNLTPTKTQPAIARIATNRSLTQGAISRIANNRTVTQPAIARVSNTRSSTQPAIARVARNLTKTQPAVARIQVPVSKTQPATARLAQNLTRTQPAISRISNIRALTQPAIARVARNLTKTQPATARIANSGVVKTQPATARIATNRALTQGAVSRISNTRTATQPAIARVAKNITKTQPAIARLAKSVSATQPAIARVANNRTKTQPAISRISQTLTKTQPAVSRVAKNLTKTQPAVASIVVNGTVTKNQPAISRIAVNRSLTQTATARLARTFTRTQGAIARIGASGTKTQLATGRIAKNVSRTQPATASIIQRHSFTQPATARIYQTFVVSKSSSLTLQQPLPLSLTLTQASTTITCKLPTVTTLTCPAPQPITLTLKQPNVTTITLIKPTTTITAVLTGTTSVVSTF